jgi:nitrile hydratase beta subunit
LRRYILERRIHVNGIHDMGGMHGFGPIVYEADEPVFHHAWEGRICAIHVRLPFSKHTRLAIESMDPALYLKSSYYEKWLYIRTQDLIETHVFTRQELDERIAYYRDHPHATLPGREDPERVQRTVAAIYAPESHRREILTQPAFRIDTPVKVRNVHPAGHTRLPRYARGKNAVVVRYYGVQEFNDTMPSGAKPEPQPLYSVRFEAQELWGESAEPNSAVYLDMWESYLEPV